VFAPPNPQTNHDPPYTGIFHIPVEKQRIIETLKTFVRRLAASLSIPLPPARDLLSPAWSTNRTRFCWSLAPPPPSRSLLTNWRQLACSMRYQDSGAANLISFLSAQPFTNLSGDFEKISPNGLTAFYEISFSNANIQKLNLESRLDDIHDGSSGFSSNMKVNGDTVNDKAGSDGKTSKAVLEPLLQHAPKNRWGVWVTGFGDFVNVDGDGNAQGYNFTTGGVSLGLDYRLTDQLAIGVSATTLILGPL
jgi:Autotransporter beta-domain